MDAEIQQISKARQASQATYFAYRASCETPDSYYTRADRLRKYRRAAEHEARLRGAYWQAHGREPLL